MEKEQRDHSEFIMPAIEKKKRLAIQGIDWWHTRKEIKCIHAPTHPKREINVCDDCRGILKKEGIL